MKATNIFSLKNARAEWKTIKGTPCKVIKQIYASIENDETAKELRAILPADRQKCIDESAQICAVYKVGETRETARGSYIVKFSADMVFRYYTNKLNTEHKNAVKTANANERAEKRAAKEKAQAEKAAEKAKAQAEKEQKRAEKNAVNAARIEAEKKETAKETAKRNAKKNGKK